MANSIYAIPIKKLYDEKNDPTMESFTSDLDIDLKTDIACSYPTVFDLKKAITDAGLKISVEQNKNFQGEDGWCCGIKEPEGYETPVSADKVKSEYEPITDLISFPRGNWKTVVNLLVELEKIIGPILFYCDSGQMTMIKKGKTTEQILKEME
tara:strand:+ start:9612 stop:10070 length:459 start_codon:yes stop_codon:yes gene_type:complete